MSVVVVVVVVVVILSSLASLAHSASLSLLSCLLFVVCRLIDSFVLCCVVCFTSFRLTAFASLGKPILFDLDQPYFDPVEEGLKK